MPEVVPRFRRASLLAGLILFGAASATAATVTNEESAQASVYVGGALIDSDLMTVQSGNASALARFGTNTLPEARAAARSLVSGEMAANVRLDDKHRYSFTVVDSAVGSARYKLEVEPDNVFLQRAQLSFYLPPSFLEITSNAELPQNGLRMTISATLKVCFTDFVCPIGSDQFKFDADLEANYQGTQRLDVQVSGAAGLDFTALRAPTVSDTGNAPVNGSMPFYRTVNVTFSDFTGHLDLGEIPVGTPLTVEYEMSARGEGRLIDNIGLAGINDPFVLDTDPLPGGPSLTLVAAPVPEPGAFALWLAGTLLLGGYAARRRVAR